MDCKLELEKQLAIDYDCSLKEVQGNKNIFKVMKNNKGCRPIVDEDCLLKICCYGEKILLMASERIINWCKETFENANATWFSEPQNLCMINDKLKEYNNCLADVHHYYIPTKEVINVDNRFNEEWYEEEEIMKFKDDDRFNEAVIFDEKTPDIIAVCAVSNNTILGMAGATADSENIWQIGVNVTEEGRGKGVGSYVVTLLKNKLLEKGKVPIYGTVESHFKSQCVAINSGFKPVFLELYSSCL